DGHPFAERCGGIRSQDEVPPGAADRSEAGGNRGKYVPERADPRPPELVRVAVDHPVRPELRCRQARHPGHPFGLPVRRAQLTDELEMPLALVPLENLRRRVAIAVI